jgi:Alkylmercury lyase
MTDRSSHTGTNPGAGPFAVVLDELPESATAVRSAGFVHLRRGHAATVEDVANGSGIDADTVRHTLSVLAHRGAAELDAESRLVGIGGLSLVATPHELVLDGVMLHTWCAVDALGIPAALNADATARTHCHHCGRRIEVRFAAGAPTSPSPIITWYPRAVGTNLRRSFCDAANAFCNQEHLQAWRAAHGEPAGEALSLVDVTARGRTIWGPEAQCCC